MLVTQILIDGFAVSALYALGATGFTLIFGVSGVLNLSHGALMVAAAVAAHQQLGLDQVRVIPAGQAPLRTGSPVASAADAFARTAVALAASAPRPALPGRAAILRKRAPTAARPSM